ncbi:MAG: hypothetical protein R3C58_15165 [Parvularculaceae bacterium]
MSLASDVTRYLSGYLGLIFAAGLACLMALAGLTLRDVGLSRTLNAPAVCLRMIGALCVSILMFWLCGYELAFNVESGGFLGDFAMWSPDDADPGSAGRAAGAVFFFHASLASLGAGIIAAAISERVRLWPFMFFCAAWSGLIYPIVVSWVWGGGFFASEWSFSDKGGAAAIHVAAGASALAAVLVVGPRQGRYTHGASRPQVSTALPLSAFGLSLAVAAFLVILAGLAGSFSSVEAAISLGMIAANGMLAAAGGSLAAMFLTQTVYKRAGLVTAMTGSLAGLISVAADPVAPALWQAAMIGAVGGVIVTVTPPFLDRFRFDDAGFSVPVHFFCGLWGVLVAFWVNDDVWLAGQAVGAAAISGFSFLMSLLIWTALKYTIGVRSAPIDEAG